MEITYCNTYMSSQYEHDPCLEDSSHFCEEYTSDKITIKLGGEYKKKKIKIKKINQIEKN